MLDLPAALIIGAVSGLLGAAFINFSLISGGLRKKFVNTPMKRIIECVVFAVVTASAFYGVATLRKENCPSKIGKFFCNSGIKTACIFVLGKSKEIS